MNKQTIYDIDAAGKTVYVRVDYNVPCDKDGHITDDRSCLLYTSDAADE